jgi:hypothetical protein
MPPGLVKAGASRYSPPMPSPEAPSPLTRDALRILARAQGLALSEADLDTVLPLVRATRALLDELTDAPLADVEPTPLYQME